MAHNSGIYKIRGPNYPGYSYSENVPVVDKEFTSLSSARAYAWKLVTTDYKRGVTVTSWDDYNGVDGIVGRALIKNGRVVWEDNAYYSDKPKSRTYGLSSDGSLYAL